MKKLRVMTILGTRPEIIRLSACIRACDRCFEHILCHTGQNYDYTLNEIFFQDLGLRAPDFYLDCVGEHLGETMGNVISKSYALLEKAKPDALLILGDTNSALCAISAKRLKIPIFHLEAGNRCFDQNVPEEINRKIVDHISDVNLTYTEHGRRNLLAEGLPPQFTFTVGSPMQEVLLAHTEAIAQSDVLSQLRLEPGSYFILSAHREENVDDDRHLFPLMQAVNMVAETYGLPVVFSTHPRSAKRLQERRLELHPLVKSMPPFGFSAYVHLQQHAYCVLSDSGTLSEESAMLGFPGVLVRNSTERPEAVDAGTVVLGGITPETILQAIPMARMQAARIPPREYDEPNMSEKVMRIILGYTSIVNERIWRKC